MNVGIQDGLIDPKHEQAMGAAIWLYLWCIRSQTKGSFVLGGTPLTYRIISQKSGFAERKVRRWMTVLRKSNYVRVTHLNFMMLRIEIVKAKKWAPKQGHLGFESRPETVKGYPHPLTENGQDTCPKTVKGVTKNGQPKQSCILRHIEPTTKESLVPVELWLSYVEMRKRIRKPMTDHAGELIRRELQKLKDQGHDPIEVLERSIMNSWQGVFPLKGHRNGQPESFAERNIRRADEELGEVSRRSQQILQELGQRVSQPANRTGHSRLLPGGAVGPKP